MFEELHTSNRDTLPQLSIISLASRPFSEIQCQQKQLHESASLARQELHLKDAQHNRQQSNLAHHQRDASRREMPHQRRSLLERDHQMFNVCHAQCLLKLSFSVYHLPWAPPANHHPPTQRETQPLKAVAAVISPEPSHSRKSDDTNAPTTF